LRRAIVSISTYSMHFCRTDATPPAPRLENLAKARASRARLRRMSIRNFRNAMPAPLAGAWAGFVYFYTEYAKGRARP
jgi:hypothetical protein